MPCQMIERFELAQLAFAIGFENVWSIICCPQLTEFGLGAPYPTHSVFREL